MPSNSGHHHRGRQRAVKAPGDKALLFGSPRSRHEFRYSFGWSWCSCDQWRQEGNGFVTKGSWRAHVAEIRRREREEAQSGAEAPQRGRKKAR
jgi:hypothetical protein